MNMTCNAKQSIDVKACFFAPLADPKAEPERRRFKLPELSFQQLQCQLRSLLNISPNVDLILQYPDNEGDAITMSTDSELNEAVQFSQDGLLRVDVRCKEAPKVPEDVVLQASPQTFDLATKTQDVSNPPAVQDSFRGRRWRPCEWKRDHPAQDKDAKDFHSWPQKRHRMGGHFDHPPRAARLIARHVKDVTIPDGTELPPATPFVKTWKIRNEGPQWPASCRLMFVGRNSDRMSGPDHVMLPEGPVGEGAEIDISVPLVSPADPGRYVGYWRLCTPEGRKFGQRMWVSITVSGSSSSDEQFKVHEDAKFLDLVQTVEKMVVGADRRVILKMLRKNDGNVDQVVERLAFKTPKRCNQ